MEYLQTHTQKFNLNQEKKDFLCHPSPSGGGGGGGLLQPPLPPNFWNDPLEENFHHSFVALTPIGG